MTKMHAFTLIELLIVVSIIALLSTLAYPAYHSYLLQAQRTKAKVTLLNAQLKQSSLHILNPLYSDDVIQLGLHATPYYTYQVLSASMHTYVIHASAQGSQVHDSDCNLLTVNQDNVQTPSHCW